MGLSLSERVSQTLRDSSAFNSVCDSVYEECLILTQHAFPGVKPYQLASASDRIHHSLTLIHYPLVQKWVPSPLSRSQVDKALRSVIRQFDLSEEETVLGTAEFRAFGVKLFADAVVSNAGKAVLVRVPIGVAGIAGIGVATRSGKYLVGTAIGVYVVGVATSIYLSLAG